MGLRYVIAFIEDIKIQPVQPSEECDSPQKRFLKKHGEGVYHVAFTVGSVNEAEKACEEKGLKTISRGRHPDQSGFNYLDTEGEIGVTLLVRETYH